MALEDADVVRQRETTGNAAAKIPVDSDAVNQRFQGELELVEIIAGQVSKSIDNCVEFDELMAAGREGLFDAARRFDPTRGIPFRAYANYRVEGAIVDAVRKSMQLPRRAHERLVAREAAREIAKTDVECALVDDSSQFWDVDADRYLVDQLTMMATSAATSIQSQWPLHATVDEAVDSNPEESFLRAEFMSQVREAFAELEPQEARAIQLRYFEGLSFGELASAMNMSKAWVQRLHANGMDRMSRKLRRAFA